jgi:hypothetical protein
MEYGPLQHPLKPEGRLGFPFPGVFRKHRCSAFNELGEFAPESVDIRAYGAQHRTRRRIIEKRQKQVFNGHEFVPLPPSFAESVVEGRFKVFAEHTALLLWSRPLVGHLNLG